MVSGRMGPLELEQKLEEQSDKRRLLRSSSVAGMGSFQALETSTGSLEFQHGRSSVEKSRESASPIHLGFPDAL